MQFILFYFVFFGKIGSGNKPLLRLSFQSQPIKTKGCSEESRIMEMQGLRNTIAKMKPQRGQPN